MLKRLGQSLRIMGTEYTELCSRELHKLKSMQLLYETGEGTWCSLRSPCSNVHPSCPTPANQQSAINENSSCKQLIYGFLNGQAQL